MQYFNLILTLFAQMNDTFDYLVVDPMIPADNARPDTSLPNVVNHNPRLTPNYSNGNHTVHNGLYQRANPTNNNQSGIIDPHRGGIPSSADADESVQRGIIEPNTILRVLLPSDSSSPRGADYQDSGYNTYNTGTRSAGVDYNEMGYNTVTGGYNTGTGTRSGNVVHFNVPSSGTPSVTLPRPFYSRSESVPIQDTNPHSPHSASSDNSQAPGKHVSFLCLF